MKEKTGTKACKYCKSEIPADAKVCPTCKKKQGGKTKFIVLAVVAVLIIIIAATSGGSDEPRKVDGAGQETSLDTNASEATGKTEFSVGDTAEQNDVQVTLVSVTESTGSDFSAPADGKVFLLCEFDIVNNSSKDISVSSIANFEAYCDDYAVNQSLMGLQAPEAEGKGQMDGTVAAGKKMNGVIAYEVPADYESFEIHVAVDIWKDKDIKFIAHK